MVPTGTTAWALALFGADWRPPMLTAGLDGDRPGNGYDDEAGQTRDADGFLRFEGDEA